MSSQLRVIHIFVKQVIWWKYSTFMLRVVINSGKFVFLRISTLC